MQVLIGQNQKRQKVVGFFNSTHLHAPEGKCDVSPWLTCMALNPDWLWLTTPLRPLCVRWRRDPLRSAGHGDQVDRRLPVRPPAAWRARCVWRALRRLQLRQLLAWCAVLWSVCLQSPSLSHSVNSLNLPCSSIGCRSRRREGTESLPVRAVQGSLQGGARKRETLGHRCVIYYFLLLFIVRLIYLYLKMSLNTIFVFQGTLLEQPTLYEDDIITPENLQKYVNV